MLMLPNRANQREPVDMSAIVRAPWTARGVRSSRVGCQIRQECESHREKNQLRCEVRRIQAGFPGSGVIDFHSAREYRTGGIGGGTILRREEKWNFHAR
jgi:hypothetical protein